LKQQKGFKYAYTAGLIDGEGCITIPHRTPEQAHRPSRVAYLRVSVNMMDGECIDFLYGVWGGNIHNRKDGLVYWELNGDKAREMLKKILPFLRAKKDQAELAIQFQSGVRKDCRKVSDFEWTRRDTIAKALKNRKRIHKPSRAVAETERADSSEEEKRQSVLTGIRTVS
jgi:hypothetical protein